MFGTQQKEAIRQLLDAYALHAYHVDGNAIVQGLYSFHGITDSGSVLRHPADVERVLQESGGRGEGVPSLVLREESHG